MSLPINKVDVILFSPTHNNYVEVVDRKRMRISHKNSLLDTPWDNFVFKYKYLVKSAKQTHIVTELEYFYKCLKVVEKDLPLVFRWYKVDKIFRVMQNETLHVRETHYWFAFLCGYFYKSSFGLAFWPIKKEYIDTGYVIGRFQLKAR